MDSLRFVELGLRPYLEVRHLQTTLAKDFEENTVILCEHPLSVTCGKRSSAEERAALRRLSTSLGAEFFEVERGGQGTVHLPGQLLIYPIIRLKNRGIRRFMEAGLSALQASFDEFGMTTTPKLCPLGLWVKDKKLASAGIQVSRGVTNHGFSLNISCDLGPYKLFNPCGLSGDKYSSVAKEFGVCPQGELVASIRRHLSSFWQEI